MVAKRHRIVSVFHPWRMLTMEDMDIMLRMPHPVYRLYRDADKADYMLMCAYECLRNCFEARGI